MSVADGTYLIHYMAEDSLNYYTRVEYEGQVIGTVSGGSNKTPTEWKVQKHPSSNTYTITAKETQGSWTCAKNKQGTDYIVMFSSNPSGSSHHWKFIDPSPTNDPSPTKEPIIGIASAESLKGGNLCVNLDPSQETLRLDWIQGESVHNRVPKWRFIKP